MFIFVARLADLRPLIKIFSHYPLHASSREIVNKMDYVIYVHYLILVQSRTIHCACYLCCRCFFLSQGSAEKHLPTSTNITSTALQMGDH